MKIDELLETLKTLKDVLENSPVVPVWDKVILDKEKIYELIEKLEKSIPNEFLEAKRIVENREKILNRAYLEAEEIIRQAKEEADILISKNNITLEARKRAEEIIKEAKRESEELKKEIDIYISNLLNKVEDLLKKELELIRKCKSEI